MCNNERILCCSEAKCNNLERHYNIEHGITLNCLHVDIIIIINTLKAEADPQHHQAIAEALPQCCQASSVGSGYESQVRYNIAKIIYSWVCGRGLSSITSSVLKL